MDKKRILHVGLKENYGGIETCVMAYNRKLCHEGFAFDFADIFGNGIAFAEEIVELGGKIYSLGNSKRHPIRVKKKLQQLIEKEDYECIHIHLLSAANIVPLKAAASACNKKKRKVIIHCHNTDVPHGLLRKFLNNIHQGTFRKQSIEKWACSVEAGKWMWGDAFEELPNHYVMKNAIDYSHFRKNNVARELIRKKFYFEESDIVLGYAGRLCEQKNVLFLAEVFTEIAKEQKNVKLLIVGDGPDKKQMDQIFAENSVIGNVAYAGLVPDVADYYNAMDYFLFPSLFEGLGISAVEAQAVGLKCFLSDEVPKDANISNTASYLPVKNGIGPWVLEIKQQINKQREDDIALTLDRNYDINYAAEKLIEQYKK